MIGGGLGALVERPFRLLWIGRTTSAVGDALMPVTLAFAVLSVGGNAGDIGAVLAVSTVARVALMLFGGALADRLSRRLLLVGSDVFLLAVQATVGVLLLTRGTSVTILLIAAVGYGSASAVSKPALSGLLPQTVSRPRLQQANALMEMSRSTAQIVGPAIAGLTIAVASPGWVYLVDAGTFLTSALALGRLELPPPSRRENGSFFHDLAVGWHDVTSRTWYWAALCGHAVWNLGFCAFLVLGPVIVAEQAGGASAWGLVSTGMAIGSLLGGLATLRIRPRRPLLVAHLGLLLSAFQLLALIGPSPVLVSVAAAALAAAGVSFINGVWTTAVQQLIPEEVLSRASSYDWLVSFTVAPIGYALAGPVAQQIGITSTLWIATGLIVMAVVAILSVPRIRSLRQDGDGRLADWPELQSRPDGPEEPNEPNARTRVNARALAGSHK